MQQNSSTYRYCLQEIIDIKSFISLHSNFANKDVFYLVQRSIEKALKIQRTFGYSEDIVRNQMEEIGVLICQLYKIEKISKGKMANVQQPTANPKVSSNTTAKYSQPSSKVEIEQNDVKNNIKVSIEIPQHNTSHSTSLKININSGNIDVVKNEVVKNSNSNNNNEQACNKCGSKNCGRKSPNKMDKMLQQMSKRTVVNDQESAQSSKNYAQTGDKFEDNSRKRVIDSFKEDPTSPAKKPKLTYPKKLYVNETREISDIIMKYERKY